MTHIFLNLYLRKLPVQQKRVKEGKIMLLTKTYHLQFGISVIFFKYSNKYNIDFPDYKP